MTKPTEKPARRVVFPLHVPTDQYDRIVAASRLSGDSIAAFIRAAALAAADRALKKKAA